MGKFGTVTSTPNQAGDTVYGLKQTKAQAMAMAAAPDATGRAPRDLASTLRGNGVYTIEDVSGDPETPSSTHDTNTRNDLRRFGGGWTTAKHGGGGPIGEYTGNGRKQPILGRTIIDYDQTRETAREAGLPDSTTEDTAQAHSLGHEVLAHAHREQSVDFRISIPAPGEMGNYTTGAAQTEDDALNYERLYLDPALGLPAFR